MFVVESWLLGWLAGRGPPCLAAEQAAAPARLLLGSNPVAVSTRNEEMWRLAYGQNGRGQDSPV